MFFPILYSTASIFFRLFSILYYIMCTKEIPNALDISALEVITGLLISFFILFILLIFCHKAMFRSSVHHPMMALRCYEYWGARRFCLRPSRLIYSLIKVFYLLTRTITLAEVGLRITAVDKQGTLDLHLDNLHLGSQIFFLFHFLLSLF